MTLSAALATSMYLDPGMVIRGVNDDKHIENKILQYIHQLPRTQISTNKI